MRIRVCLQSGEVEATAGWVTYATENEFSCPGLRPWAKHSHPGSLFVYSPSPAAVTAAHITSRYPD